MEEQHSGQSALDYQFICQTVGSLYLDWLNSRRQSASMNESVESSYTERISSLQNQIEELITENENLKVALLDDEPDAQEDTPEEE